MAVGYGEARVLGAEPLLRYFNFLVWKLHSCALLKVYDVCNGEQNLQPIFVPEELILPSPPPPFPANYAMDSYP